MGGEKHKIEYLTPLAINPYPASPSIVSIIQNKGYITPQISAFTTLQDRSSPGSGCPGPSPKSSRPLLQRPELLMDASTEFKTTWEDCLPSTAHPAPSKEHQDPSPQKVLLCIRFLLVEHWEVRHLRMKTVAPGKSGPTSSQPQSMKLLLLRPSCDVDHWSLKSGCPIVHPSVVADDWYSSSTECAHRGFASHPNMCAHYGHTTLGLCHRMCGQRMTDVSGGGLEVTPWHPQSFS